MIVSHDRYFMDRLVDHLFVFEGNGEVRDFPGNYTQYRLWLKEQEELAAKEAESKATTPAAQSQIASTSPKKKMGFKEKKEFELLEKEMPLLEEEKHALTNQMSSAKLPFEELQKISNRMIEINRLLEEKEMRWLELSELQ